MVAGKITLTCKDCGKMTSVFPSQISGRSARYKTPDAYRCRPCWNKARRGLRVNPVVATTVEMACHDCGIVKSLSAAKAAESMRPYRCRECYLKARAAGTITHTRGGTVEVACPGCGVVRKRKKSHDAKRSPFCLSCKNKGHRNPSWMGGTKHNPYPGHWCESLREMIRERDGRRCRNCNKRERGRRLSVHHVDYIRENTVPENLVSLCCSCHSLTNTNREYWRWKLSLLLQGGVR